ncbi:MAG: hypothetical protein QF615_07265 [Planctomycetota bacterium]|nr:hypothetical protein [Planctomycetota bacterium]
MNLCLHSFVAACLLALTLSPMAAGQASQTSSPVEMLRLRSGDILWARVVEHTPEGVFVERLSNGGRASLTWGFLDPLQEEELRMRYGYVDLAQEEIMIEVDQLLLSDGSEVVGKVISREGDTLTVKVDGNLLLIPKIRVAASGATVRVPALDIYTRDELYGQLLVATAPDDPEAQLALARDCERILDYAHAVLHYQKASELDPELHADEVAYGLARAEQKAVLQEQIDYLAEADHLRKRGKFDEALAMCESFAERFPDSILQEDALKGRDRVLRGRDEALRELVARRWHYWVTRLAKVAAVGSYEQAIDYLDENMGKEVLDRVLDDARRITAEIGEDDVTAFWVERKRGRWKRASYGYGTWLLGEDEALAGLEDGPKVATGGEKDEERLALEERIQRFLRNQEQARKARGSKDDEDDIEAAWVQLSSSSRAWWIIAYYAEFSGEMELDPKPSLSNCRECGGVGVREVIYTGGARSGESTSGKRLMHCPTCHGIGRVRRIRYR